MAAGETDIQLDDCFVFLGLTGLTYKEQNIMAIANVNFSGHITYEWWVWQTSTFGKDRWIKKGEYQAGLADVMEMVRQHIWDYVGKAPEILGQSVHRPLTAEPKEAKKPFSISNISSGR